MAFGPLDQSEVDAAWRREIAAEPELYRRYLKTHLNALLERVGRFRRYGTAEEWERFLSLAKSKRASSDPVDRLRIQEEMDALESSVDARYQAAMAEETGDFERAKDIALNHATWLRRHRAARLVLNRLGSRDVSFEIARATGTVTLTFPSHRSPRTDSVVEQFRREWSLEIRDPRMKRRKVMLRYFPDESVAAPENSLSCSSELRTSRMRD